jgi:DNA-binding NarL/FixJ family response regulator
MINLFIIDDHILIIKGLKNIFRSANDSIHVAGFSHDIDSGIEGIKNCNVDIILLDLYLGKSDPINNISILRDTFPKIPIIILSCETSNIWKCKTFQVGVQGFISKSEDINLLKETLFLVYNGKSVIPKGLSGQPLLSNLNNNQSFYNSKMLNQREFVFDLGNGLSIKEIANKYNLTISAIEKKLTNLRNEYQAKSNPELVKIFCHNMEI